MGYRVARHSRGGCSILASSVLEIKNKSVGKNVVSV